MQAGALQEVRLDESIDWVAGRQFWSIRPPARQPKPLVAQPEWPEQPIDYFVLARLEQQQMSPSIAADKRTLLRRVTYDITGLPPTREELAAFLEDDRADAYDRVVDRLLASPRFGERFASLWLPLARYAEDQAHQVGDDTKFFYPNAYKYREWVVNAINRDVPYDWFVTLQIAADKIDGVDQSDLAALGFLGLGPKYYNRNRLDVMADEWEDRVDTVTRTMLGLTVACARCHDHKYEPVTQQDYYALAGVFASTKMVNRTPAGGAENADAKADKFDPNTLHVVEDGDVRNLQVFVRGRVEQLGPVAQRRFLTLLSPDTPTPFHAGSGRLELAAAITDWRNPLTHRVFVNRVWGWLFGQPIVLTPSNFGQSGQPPTHPELLDDLTCRFVENGSSVKTLVREMALSATYRQASQDNLANAERDPTNELLWRMNRRRLSIEQWRDSMLVATGQLEQGGGKSKELSDPLNFRRTLYARISRLQLNDVLTQFDYPDANVHSEKRAVTTTPTQKLFMLNSPFVLDRAFSLAEALAQANPRDAERVVAIYDLLFSRVPSLEELRLALYFLGKPTSAHATRWQQYTQMLLVSNEMLFVD
jgi:hypothetical protein